MSTFMNKRSDVPKAPYYVLCNDKFMSGWGPAEGLTNTLIFPCESYEEAEIVRDNADMRSEMKKVRIVERKNFRLQNGGVLYSLYSKGEVSDTWYEKEGWVRMVGLH